MKWPWMRRRAVDRATSKALADGAALIHEMNATLAERTQEVAYLNLHVAVLERERERLAALVPWP